ncbi:unannotated protein [freshwater metagenome]|uniref:Unannotated protein n=1 Tax=freshwater metagenome TaxID=449393 RepID=A0A6J7CMP0_9ZZZZ
MDLLDGNSPEEEFPDLEDPVGRRDRDHAEQFGVGTAGELALGGIAVEAETTLLERAQRLLEAFGERSPDRHYLTDTLHLRAEHARGSRQLLEGPARDLRDHVVDGRLEACRRHLRDVVGNLVEAVADRKLCCNLRDREACCLGGKRARTGDPGVHLNDDLLTRAWVDRELHVRPARLHTDAPDALEGCVTHFLVLDVAEGLGRGHGDRVTGMNPHGVEVLDRADDHAIVLAVAHDLELEFLPTLDGALDQDFTDGAGRDPVGSDDPELVHRLGDARAAPAEDVRRAYYHGQAQLLKHRIRLLH